MHHFIVFNLIELLNMPTQYVAGFDPNTKASLPPLSIALSTSSCVIVFQVELASADTASSTVPTKFLDRKKAESSSATNGIEGNNLLNSVLIR
jgi:hypothetical protein